LSRHNKKVALVYSLKSVKKRRKISGNVKHNILY